jgi:hypothetical protein
MRQASKRVPDSAEKMVRDIRRATRRHHSAEEKIRIVLEGLRARSALPNSAARRVTGEPLLACLQELLRPTIIKVLVDPLLARGDLGRGQGSQG